MGLKETLEELIDEYEDDEPFLADGERVVLATYRRLLEEEKETRRLLNLDQRGTVKSSVRPSQPSRRGTR